VENLLANIYNIIRVVDTMVTYLIIKYHLEDTKVQEGLIWMEERCNITRLWEGLPRRMYTGVMD
jgi:hypothetical protein